MISFYLLREGLKKNGLINPSAGWLGSAWVRNPTNKKNSFAKKYKDDQNGPIHPESENFNCSLLGGSGQKSQLSVGLFDFNFLVLNILKEADINFFFKVLAKFGDNKHNKGIKKNCGKKMFFSIEGGCGGGKFWMENSITFDVFLLKPFLRRIIYFISRIVL